MISVADIIILLLQLAASQNSSIILFCYVLVHVLCIMLYEVSMRNQKE